MKNWAPGQLMECRVGDLNGLWRDLVYPQVEKLKQQNDLDGDLEGEE